MGRATLWGLGQNGKEAVRISMGLRGVLLGNDGAADQGSEIFLRGAEGSSYCQCWCQKFLWCYSLNMLLPNSYEKRNLTANVTVLGGGGAFGR